MSFESIKIARELEKYHGLFYKMWDVGKPIITKDEKIPTAAVSFDRLGNHLSFYFNKKFYNELSIYEKSFVVSHEMLHIILNHGKRKREGDIHSLLNVAQDVAIHELMFNTFGFEMSKLQHDLFQNFCTRENVEKSYKVKLDAMESAEYYYDMLRDKVQVIKLSMIDNHEFHEGCDGMTIDISEEELDSMESHLSESKESEKEGGQEAGKGAGGARRIFKVKPVRKKVWESIIKNWVIKNSTFTTEEQWTYKNPRLNLMSSALLPYEKFKEKDDKSKKEIFLFQDTSGSCVSFAERFLKVARSIPEDKFVIRFFCFDTSTYEIDYKTGELQGFGGTRFDIIETEIQNIIKKENRPYPQGVFVVTDGFGNSVSPEKPDRWHWLMTDYHSMNYVPSTSKTFKLEEFE